MKITLVIFKLVFLGALFIISNHELHLNDTQQRTIFLEDYYSWLRTLYDQGVDVVGYVVRSEWLPVDNPVSN